MAAPKKAGRTSRQGGGRKGDGARETKMDLFGLLKQDHEKVKGLFEEIEQNGEDTEAQQEIFSQIEQELKIHMEGEEKFYYPALEEDDDAREKVLEAYEEHHVAKNVLSEFEDLDMDDERWKPKLKVLKEIVEHHIEEEEKEVFKATRKALDKERIQEIAEQIQEQKVEMAGL